MKILHIVNHTKPLNGNVNVAVDLACTQAQMGHSVKLISQGGYFDEVLSNSSVEHIKVDFTRRPLTLLKALRDLWITLKDYQPEIVHAHMMTVALLSFLFRPFFNFRLITTVHNEFEKSAILMGVGDLVVAVSQAVANKMVDRGIPYSKLRVVINGVIGTPRLSSTLPSPKPLSHPAVIYVGGLHPRKAVDDLIEAFAITAHRITKAHLYIIGAGPCRDAYEKQAAETGVTDRIIFCGGEMDPRTYLLSGDLFILASHAEPGGLVIAEARSCGCAVIATQVDGIPEMLEGGKAGLLVPSKRPDLLAESMIQVLSDEQILTDLKQRSLRNIDFFIIERAAKDYLAIYEEALSVD